MFLCHIVDDFVLQPVCLSKLKQKEWWRTNYPDPLYKDDYKVALGIHSLSWAIMIHLPFILMTEVDGGIIWITVILDALVHYTVDNEKANKHSISLLVDQMLHFLQIGLTWVFLTLI